MKRNDCNIVRDLMPLVLDRVASDESREAVETHIISCEECRRQYDAMKSNLPEGTRAEYEEEQKQCEVITRVFFLALLKSNMEIRCVCNVTNDINDENEDN